MPWAAAAGAAVSAGSQLAGSAKSSSAAKEASGMQQKQAEATMQELLPYVTSGYGALGPYNALAQAGPFGGMPNWLGPQGASGIFPQQMTQAELEATPGYQFTLGQGLKGVQSAAAARGLGVSGAALKGAGEYATQLANKTYQDQFAIAQKRFEDALKMNEGYQSVLNNYTARLHDAAALGSNAGAQTATANTNAINSAGGYLSSAGMREGSGIANTGNALNQGLQSYLGYSQLQDLMTRQQPQQPLPAGADVPAEMGGRY